MSDPLLTRSWPRLSELAETAGQRHLTELFAADATRAERYCVEACGLTLDYSKQRIDDATRTALIELFDEQDVAGARDAMFAGQPINTSEDRAAWHVALRAPHEAPMHQGVHGTRRAMAAFAEEVRSGAWTGFDGQTITDVVNIGIGGSDLGPRLVCESLGAHDVPRPHFVANVDPHDLDDTLAKLDPARTLVIVTSKSFGTAETLANARVARRWLTAAGAAEGDIAKHFVAVSTNEDKVRAFGIERMFGFWDWVGGRYSLWSAVGLSILLAVGETRFEALLAGAHAMDRHFAEAPVNDNLPVWLALTGIWNNNFLGLASHCVVPYAQRMANLPSFLQQLEMESNGKSVTREGMPTTVATVPTIWGSVGTNAQHAFFQMLHQGPRPHPVDFILPLAADHDDAGQQRLLIANCLAQSAALMAGRDRDTVRAELEAAGMTPEAAGAAAPHRVFSGNRPSATLLVPRLDARHLGALLAAYEHRCFVQSVLWGINAFDQWGVELGKQLAKTVDAALRGEADMPLDADTEALIQRALKRAS